MDNYKAIGKIASFYPIPKGSRVNFRSIPYRVKAKETENQLSKPGGSEVTNMDLKFALFVYSCMIALLMGGCTEDKNIAPQSNLIEEYYPIQEGDSRTYAIDSITYDYDGLLRKIVIDTQQYFLRERVLGQILHDDANWWQIGLYKSPILEGDYELIDYIYLRHTGHQLLRKEGHLVFIPLASPFQLFDEWDGTAHFNPGQTQFFIRGEIITPYKDWNYVYFNKWDQYEVNGRTYPDVIQVNQKDTISIEIDQGGGSLSPEEQLFYTLANEYYAPGVGLIEKSEYHLTSICASANASDFLAFCDTTTIFANAERGYIYHKKLIAVE